jgi:hypothetical protein
MFKDSRICYCWTGLIAQCHIVVFITKILSKGTHLVKLLNSVNLV